MTDCLCLQQLPAGGGLKLTIKTTKTIAKGELLSCNYDGYRGLPARAFTEGTADEGNAILLLHRGVDCEAQLSQLWFWLAKRLGLASMNAAAYMQWLAQAPESRPALDAWLSCQDAAVREAFTNLQG